MPTIRDQKLRLYAGQNPSAHGGSLASTRYGRRRARPLTTSASIHLTLRSTQAKGAWSFRQPHHAAKIQALVRRYSRQHEVQVFSSANVGNHLHLHIKLRRSQSYAPFIRALTAAVAMAITGRSRWNPGPKGKLKFWDQRPFTRLVQSTRGFLRLQDYVAVNTLEGDGIARKTARWILGWRTRGRALA